MIFWITNKVQGFLVINIVKAWWPVIKFCEQKIVLNVSWMMYLWKKDVNIFNYHGELTTIVFCQIYCKLTLFTSLLVRGIEPRPSFMLSKHSSLTEVIPVIRKWAPPPTLHFWNCFIKMNMPKLNEDKLKIYWAKCSRILDSASILSHQVEGGIRLWCIILYTEEHKTGQQCVAHSRIPVSGKYTVIILGIWVGTIITFPLCVHWWLRNV